MCCQKKRKTRAVQTYYTCLPNKLSDAEKESHGLQTIDIEKGHRIVEGSSGTNTMTLANTQADTVPTISPNQPGAGIQVLPTAHDYLEPQNKPTRKAPPVPRQLSNDEHDYENQQNWTNPDDHQPIGASYRMSQIQPLNQTNEYTDDDVVSAAFTNDSFEHDDQYINTADLRNIHQVLNN